MVALTVAIVALILSVKPVTRGEATAKVPVFDEQSKPVGQIALYSLTSDGSMRLAFVPESGVRSELARLEWWQLAERQDRPGYPRIDPQSGGSGLPGARGEDEDPAYYSSADFADPDLAPRIQADGKLWLLDHPTHDSGFNFESWLVRRTGPKSARRLCGIEWGIRRAADGSLTYRDPRPLRKLSRFNWEEALRISGFGSGWEIETAYRFAIP